MSDDDQMPLPRLIHHYSDRLAVGFGFLFNTTLLLIVRANKKSDLKSFGQIVIMNCILDKFIIKLVLIIEYILDLYLNFTTLLSEIQTDTHQGVLYFFVNSFLVDYIPRSWHYILIYLWCLGKCSQNSLFRLAQKENFVNIVFRHWIFCLLHSAAILSPFYVDLQVSFGYMVS
jgi:hypothetical protein